MQGHTSCSAIGAMKTILLLTFLLSFQASFGAQNYFTVKKFGIDSCYTVDANQAYKKVSKDFCKIKDFLLVDWDQYGNCWGFDHYEKPSKKLDKVVCRKTKGIIISVNRDHTGCYEYTPQGHALKKIGPASTCASAAFQTY